jgi:Leucine-rich repeat (LRR) protein
MVVELAQLTKTVILDLSYNKLNDSEKVRQVVKEMKQLKYISLTGNSITDVIKLIQ